MKRKRIQDRGGVAQGRIRTIAKLALEADPTGKRLGKSGGQMARERRLEMRFRCLFARITQDRAGVGQDAQGHKIARRPIGRDLQNCGA